MTRHNLYLTAALFTTLIASLFPIWLVMEVTQPTSLNHQAKTELKLLLGK